MKKLIMFTIVISSLLMAGVFFGCEAGLTSNSGDSESDSGGFSFSDMYKKIDLMQKQIDTLNSSLTLTAEQAYVLNYPHILTNNHCIGITSGSGQISYAGGDFAVILGKKVQLPSFEFTTAASKTYHVRFKPAAGWSLNDLSNGAYNPGGATESDTRFDSSYEDMLAARIVTDAGNSAACTPLHNNNRLQFTLDSMLGCSSGNPIPLPPHDGQWYTTGASYRQIYGEAESGTRRLQYGNPGSYFHSQEIVTLNWARQPKAVSFSHDMGYFSNNTGNRQYSEHIEENNRYNVIVRSSWVLSNPAGCLDLSVIVSGTN